MKRNWILTAAAVALTGSLLAGCGSSNTGAGDTSAESTAAGTTEQRSKARPPKNVGQGAQEQTLRIIRPVTCLHRFRRRG